MTVKNYSLLLKMSAAAAVFYTLNKLLFLLPGLEVHYAAYHHSLEKLYLFFLACSVIVLLTVILVNARTPDNTGFAYVGGTLLQMGLCYIMLRPILGASDANAGFEKANFFLVFLLFLATETLLAIQILNKKQ
ncbi:hypothetical protein CHU92_12910 [Flavobacterium cyanobacteriorum]|uniref:Uncharacterized protein n=1 Tax=Flavobacterium cyanobacteriorum TaxID=2022802 RepID=A0A255YVL9_9FLAO|nr:DUF6168 family protein [Flavobacterium cyanobacteriorum]OYQ33287.1 hypothetical protein CHU92_12910 [Flavobacterium cyanobacteriorum]